MWSRATARHIQRSAVDRHQCLLLIPLPLNRGQTPGYGRHDRRGVGTSGTCRRKSGAGRDTRKTARQSLNAPRPTCLPSCFPFYSTECTPKVVRKICRGIWQQRANLMQGIWGNPGKSQTNGLKMADIARVTIGKPSLLPKRFDQHVKPSPVSRCSVSGENRF